MNLKQNGFTLIELIIYFAIISVVSLISVDILYSIADSRGRIESRSEVNQNLRFASERLINDIHSATAVSEPDSVGVSENILTLTLPEGSVSYSVAGGVLQRNSVNITSNNVMVDTSALTIFTRIENGAANKTIQVNLRISYNDAGRLNWQYSNSVQTTAGLK